MTPVEINAVIAQCLPYARAAQDKYSIPVSFQFAQYEIESNWGTAEPPHSNNGFGIQRLPGLPSVACASHEYIRGVYTPVTETFAVFASVADAFMKHAELIATARVYAPGMSALRRGDYDGFIDAVCQPYSTTPTYAKILRGVIQQYNLRQYDAAPRPAVVPAVPTEAKTMSFNFAGLFQLLPEAGAIAEDVGALTGQPAVSTIGALLASSQAQELEQLLASMFTMVTTPGAAAIIEPRTPTPGVAPTATAKNPIPPAAH